MIVCEFFGKSCVTCCCWCFFFSLNFFQYCLWLLFVIHVYTQYYAEKFETVNLTLAHGLFFNQWFCIFFILFIHYLCDVNWKFSITINIVSISCNTQHIITYQLELCARVLFFAWKKKTLYKFVVKIQTDRNSMNSEILVIVMLFSLTPFHFYLIFNWQATSNRHTQMNTHFSIWIDLFETKTQPYHPFNDKKVRNTVSIVYAVCIHNFYSTYKTKLTISCCFVPFIQRILTIFGRLYRFLYCIFNVN